MKHEKSESAFGRVKGLFARNFGLKFLSLALAILIYEALKPDSPNAEQPPMTVLMPRIETPAAEKAKPAPEPPPPPAAEKERTETKPADTNGRTNVTTRTNSSTSTKNNGKPRKQ